MFSKLHYISLFDFVDQKSVRCPYSISIDLVDEVVL